jgi:hypothetical protein
MEPAIEPRLGWYRPLELGLCEDSCLGKGYSFVRDGEAGENSGDAALSAGVRGAEEDMMILSRPRRPLEGSSAVSITFTSDHRGIIAGGRWDERQTS